MMRSVDAMPSCRQVMRSLVDFIDGGPKDGSRARIESHLRQCPSCAAERDAMSGIAATVAAAAAVAPGLAVTGPGFEQRVLASLRAGRKAGAVVDGSALRVRGSAWPVLRWPAPLSAAAAVAIMLLAGVLAALYGGFATSPSIDTPPAIAANDTGVWDDELLDMARADDGAATRALYNDAVGLDMRDLDMVMPAREVPFSVRQDLIGVRSGRIPATTYVLEPAPDESAVMRASF